MNSRKHASKRQNILGESFGAATCKLRKAIMFDLAQKLNLTVCFRCGKEIQLKDFSIEHKIAWMNSENPIDMFYDLDNIAFSHRSCNSRAASRPTKRFDSPAEYQREYRKTQDRSEEYKKQTKRRREQRQKTKLLEQATGKESALT